MSEKKCNLILKELNFNLKNEIISFIPVDQIFNTICSLDKSFSNAFSKRKIIKKIIQNLSEIESEIFFSDDNLTEILALFKNTNETLTIQYQLCAYLILLKYKQIKSWEFSVTSCIKNYKVVAFFLSMNKKVEKVIFEQTGISREENNYKTLFLEGFLNCINLDSISLIKEELGNNETDMLYLSQSISNLNKLVNLDLSRNMLGKNKNDLFYLAEILKTNVNLKSIDFESNCLFENLDEKNLNLFCKQIIKHENLNKLSLSHNSLGENEESFCLLVSALEVNKSLNTLILSSNRIGKSKQNVEAIICLVQNINLSVIFLSSNELGNEAIKVQTLQLLRAIEKNTNLKSVFLSENCFSINKKLGDECRKRLEDKFSDWSDYFSESSSDDMQSNFFSDYDF